MLREIIRAGAILMAVSFTLTGCAPSLAESDPNGYSACTTLDNARETNSKGGDAMSAIIFDVGAKAIQSNHDSLRNGVSKLPELSTGGSTAYDIKDSFVQACKDLGVPVRDVSKKIESYTSKREL